MQEKFLGLLFYNYDLSKIQLCFGLKTAKVCIDFTAS